MTDPTIKLIYLKLDEIANRLKEINHSSPWLKFQEYCEHHQAHSDIQLFAIAEQLDRMEKKINNRLNKTWLSISDVIQITGISRSKINRSIKLGELKSVKTKGKRMLKMEWVNRWIGG